MAGNRKAEPKEILGLNRITKKRLLELCKKNKLYQTPSLNDVLYLHYQGFQSIECLEEYTELKCLWLECNAISEIQGLDNQNKLKCLFLQSNLIKKIENLEYCKELDTINLSQNHIRKIENCGSDILPVLNTLNISSNYIKDSEGLKELEYCNNLSVLDLSNNRIDDTLVVKIFNKMPELKVLVLQGNPVVSKIPQYRKTITLECKKLTYLDSRPVFPKDRACAEAWKRGGYEEERKENERWNRKERKKMRDSVNATIRMRNKNRKPEDILTLLTSSDSEDESDVKKRSRQNDLGASVSVDSIWDEVAEDSSDLNVSSTTSETSTTDSNGQGNSSDSCAIEAGKTPAEDEQKILNDCFENKNKKDCHFAEIEETKCGKEKSLDVDVKQIVEHYESIELKKHDNQTIKRIDPDENININPKKIKIDHGESTENIDSTSKMLSLNECSLTSRPSNNSLYSDEESKEQYNDTVDAISQATMNNLSETDNNFPTTPLRSVQLQIETLNAKDDENYEPLTELEETMKTLIKKEDTERDTSRQVNFSSVNQNRVDTQECSQINNQLKKDFDKLSSDMDNFMLQLQRDKVERHEAMEVLFDKMVASKESSSASSENETEDNLVEWKLQKSVDQWEMATRLKKGKRVEEASNKMPEIWINDEPCQEGSQQETNTKSKEIEEEIKYTTARDGISHKVEREQTLIYQQGDNQDDSNYDTNMENSSPAETQTVLAKEQLYPAANLSTFPADAVDSDENDFEYIPMDITLLARNSHDALNSIEKEAKELKVLLQKLEDENMDLFNEINTETKCHDEELSKENIFKDVYELDKNESGKSIQLIYGEEINLNSKKEIVPDSNGEQNDMEDQNSKSSVAEQLLDEIIQCLDLKSLKPNSYELDIISDEEYSYTEPTVELEDLPAIKPIPDFLQSFKLFSKTISNENKQASLDKQRKYGLPELTNRRKLQDFNAETHESLDEQLELLKEEQTKQLRRMVDRVYAQKDRYNDTLEVIDGKLMVRNKDTGEVKELPPPSRHFSDSDTEYDTAQSEEEEDEEEGACCGKSRQLNRDQTHDHERTTDEGNWGFNRQRSDGWPTQRKSAENLITQALEHNRKSNLTRDENEESTSSDESPDEFFSLDPQNKPNVYGNIDAEFFNKLTLDHLKLSEQDEHHMNQCARSYEDMKTCLKLNKDEVEGSANENNEFLIERKENVNILQTSGNTDKCSKEDLLLKKLMQRAKEKEGFEIGNKESNRNINDVFINKMPYKRCKEAVKLFEYKYEQNDHTASSSNPPAKPSNEVESTSENVNDNSTEIFDKNVYTFVFEEPEAAAIEDKQQLRETELVDNEDELRRQDFIQNLLMRNITFEKSKAEEEKSSSTDLNSPKSADSILCLEKCSEEEKNEIESNVDVEGIVLNNKLELASQQECLEEKSYSESSPINEFSTEEGPNSTIECDAVAQSSEINQIKANNENCIQTHSTVTETKSSLKSPDLIKLSESENNPIIMNEQQNNLYNPDHEQHINIPPDFKSQSRTNDHVSLLPDQLTESPRSSQKTFFDEVLLNDQASSEYLLSNIPPLRSLTDQHDTEIAQSSTKNTDITSSSVGEYYELPLHAVSSEIPSQNTGTDSDQPQDASENLESQVLDVLECNLEILGGNDEIIDTITVNAELHYDY